MKKSLTDKIEQYIKVLIERSDNQRIEIQRIELAETFCCVPSQITYVINTRFTEEEGYLTESRRGEKGYVRITKFIDENDQIVETNRNELIDFIDQLLEQEDITENENKLLKQLIIKGIKDLDPRVQVHLFKNFKKIIEEYVQY
ncbi:MAG TPA: CtsR family transcriptional regulator [Syntrophomonadaceae bacterium]|nr:CtsR family transcriptional regulator [Syntrophomonadaceae bacterium]